MKKKKTIEKAQKLSPQKEKELEEKMEAITKVCLGLRNKYKMLVIIQDDKGRGISRGEGFTAVEFVQWFNAIVRFNDTNL